MSVRIHFEPICAEPFWRSDVPIPRKGEIIRCNDACFIVDGVSYEYLDGVTYVDVKLRPLVSLRSRGPQSPQSG